MARNLNQEAQNQIADAVDRFITAKETFTAAHVTMSLRAERVWAGTYSHVNAIAPEVRRIYTRNEMTGYRQSLVYIGGTQVYAYHPDGEDPNSVDLRIGGPDWLPRVDISLFRDGQAPASDGAAPRRAPGATPLATDLYNGGREASDGDTCRVPYNNEGYAQIPRAMTRLIRLEGGDGVVLEGQTLGDEVTVRRAQDGEDASARLQPTSGALRVRDRALMNFGVGEGDELTVTVNATERTLTLR